MEQSNGAPGSLVGHHLERWNTITSSRAPTHSDAAQVGEALESPVLGIFSNTTSLVVLFVLCWVGVGLTTAVLLRRRAHEFGPNAALGVVLGPLFVFLAYDMIRRRETEEPITLSHPADTQGLSVLVVLVGELERPDAALQVMDDLEQVGSVIAAVPVEYEVAQRVHTLGGFPPTSDRLDELAATLDRFSPGKTMLPGPVAKSIPSATRAIGADLVLLVGSEGQSAAPGLEEDLRSQVIRVPA